MHGSFRLYAVKKFSRFSFRNDLDFVQMMVYYYFVKQLYKDRI